MTFADKSRNGDLVRLSRGHDFRAAQLAAHQLRHEVLETRLVPLLPVARDHEPVIREDRVHEPIDEERDGVDPTDARVQGVPRRPRWARVRRGDFPWKYDAPTL